jgi:hypothetical protein
MTPSAPAPHQHRDRDRAGTGESIQECADGVAHARHVAREDQDHVRLVCTPESAKAGGDCRGRTGKGRILTRGENTTGETRRLRSHHNSVPGIRGRRQGALKEGGAVEHQGRLG